jgi:hypothetical protein
MQQAIHWDYADSFTGRDAAYLIAGFDPSSNSAEDAFRVQAIIQKLKTAYYFACSQIRGELDHELGESVHNWLHLHRYDKKELLSVKQEGMIERFMSSPYVAKGYLAELEGLDRYSSAYDIKHDFPHSEDLALAEKKWKSAKEALAKHWENLCPEIYAELMELDRKIEEEKEKEKKHIYTWNQYFDIEEELEKNCQKLREILNVKSLAVDPTISKAVEHYYQQWYEIYLKESDWYDQKRGEEEALDYKYRELCNDAKSEGYEWYATYIHEFDSQKFSRSELFRWLSDNNYPTAYSFASKQPLEEKPLSSKERTNYLNLIGSLADLYWKSAYPGEEYKQVTLLADLEKYDFSGMGERNLKEKLSLAIKAIKSA